ncbi:MAG: S8 family serine peptidase [Actinobacteria bacterium]|nr:S8 family serine peptidase [Actinomycetota bacterium]
MRPRFLAAVAAAFVMLLASLPAGATFPFPGGGDPYDYSRLHISNGSCAGVPAGQQKPSGSDLPAGFDCRGDWELTGYAPQQGDANYDPLVTSNPQELYGVTGSDTNEAWEVTTGRPDTVIAVMDSGILWDTPKLANKVHLNIGELPRPCTPSTTCDNARNNGTLQDYDINGDGVFNIADYANDARVSKRNGSYKTADDLIHSFSDAGDDDLNGYPDDIAGWDFFQHDNDAFDDTDYGHGTGEAGDSSAEIEVSVTQCPNCMFDPLRVGDSFIAQINNWAEGVVYAVDNGFSIVQEALGTLNHTGFSQVAADYAYAHGVLIVASEADEEAGHHNYPAALNHTMVVNAATHYAEQSDVALQYPKSYLAFNGCTNFGGYTWVMVEADSCSSGATGNSAGMAGLLYSAARNAIQHGQLQPDASGRPLSAEEAKQLFRVAAQDIDFSSPKPPFPANNFVTTLPDTVRYVTTAGWDQISGWGRINANALVRLVSDGKIPPQADITSPRWWQPLATSGSVPVIGSVSAPRAGGTGYSYQVQFAPGVQPPPFPAGETWTTIATGSGTAPKTGVLATLDMSAVHNAILTSVPPYTPANDPTSRDLPEKDAFRVRVIVHDSRGGIPDAIEQRQAFSYEDSSIMGGFPKYLDADGGGSIAFADINDNGNTDLVIADGNGFLHAYEPGGGEANGFPVHTDAVPFPISGNNAFTRGDVSRNVYEPALLGSPTIANLDGAGLPEIAVTDHSGAIHVWHGDGSLAWTAHVNYAYSHNPGCQEPGQAPSCDESSAHPVRDRINTVDRAFTAEPAAADLDPSTPGLELIAGAWDDHVYAWHADGTPVAGWPVMLRDPSKVASVDPVSHRIRFKDPGKTFYGKQILAGVSVGDINNDGYLEVLANVDEEYNETPNWSLRDPAVTAVDSLEKPANTRTYALYHDGTLHGSGTGAVPGLGDNAYVPGWPVKIGYITPQLLPDVGSGSNGAPVIGSIDGKTVIATASAAGPLYLLNADGSSYYGTQPGGGYITMGSSQAEFKSSATDGPSIPSLGGAVFGRLGGPLSPLSVAMGTTGLKRG